MFAWSCTVPNHISSLILSLLCWRCGRQWFVHFWHVDAGSLLTVHFEKSLCLALRRGLVITWFSFVQENRNSANIVRNTKLFPHLACVQLSLHERRQSKHTWVGCMCHLWAYSVNQTHIWRKNACYPSMHKVNQSITREGFGYSSMRGTTW